MEDKPGLQDELQGSLGHLVRTEERMGKGRVVREKGKEKRKKEEERKREGGRERPRKGRREEVMLLFREGCWV